MDFTPFGTIEANQVHPGELLVISSLNTKANAIKYKEKTNSVNTFFMGRLVGWLVREIK